MSEYSVKGNVRGHVGKGNAGDVGNVSSIRAAGAGLAKARCKLVAKLALLLLAAWVVWNLANGAKPFSIEMLGIKGESQVSHP